MQLQGWTAEQTLGRESEAVAEGDAKAGTRILLVDDHALFRSGLRGLLNSQPDFEVVGEADTAGSGLQLARELQPDVILMDLNLPDQDGVAATRQIMAELPDTRIVMLTVEEEIDQLFQAVRAGARGYLIKSIDAQELFIQLRGLSRDEAPISREMAARILDEVRRGSSLVAPDAALSEREIEILELVAARLTNKEIAARLVLSEHTVKNHLRSILSKLRVKSRRQAVDYGITRGWIRGRRPGSAG